MIVAPEEPRVEPLEFRGQLAELLFQAVLGNLKPPREILAEGPAGTGKTRTILEALYSYAERYPRSKIVFLRDTRAAMSETLMVEWEEHVLGPDHPAVLGGPQRDHREKYTFSNGSEVILRGFDKEQKLFSGQYHVIYANEATEITSEEKWQTLHRALRAVPTGGQPFKALIADCNPRQRSHWLNRRAHDPDRRGLAFDPEHDQMLRVRTKFYDNPRWYNADTGKWTEAFFEDIWNGLRRGTSGVQNIRLFQGLWEDATGALMPEFDADRHCIEARLERAHGTTLLHVKGWPAPVELRWFFAGFDAGYNAAVLGVWGVDIQGRMFEVAEHYHSKWTHDDWAKRAVGVAREFQLQGIVSDHDPSLIAAVNRALINSGYGACVREADKRMGMAGDKAKDARIEMVRARFQRNEMFFVKNCNREIDADLQARGRPWNTPMEIPNLRYREFEYGVDDIATEGKVDKSIPDHGFDMSTYSTVFAAGRQVQGERKVSSSPFERYWSGEWSGFSKAR